MPNPNALELTPEEEAIRRRIQASWTEEERLRKLQPDRPQSEPDRKTQIVAAETRKLVDRCVQLNIRTSGRSENLPTPE